jgi:hypothetical protein
LETAAILIKTARSFLALLALPFRSRLEAIVDIAHIAREAIEAMHHDHLHPLLADRQEQFLIAGALRRLAAARLLEDLDKLPGAVFDVVATTGFLVGEGVMIVRGLLLG